ncbi:muk1p [Saccharomyces arboricola H-6]|uniref:Muk1p n=1 Tax=Saccharomyces arboricola (strain H-6 / AS 2.3317 / CBS 10644) TaxID=1160507 RepID=J8PGV4_SACAR|nr:muk1p [Saccharomyces arboricola H-6]
MARQLFTPPITNPRFDPNQSIRESYKNSTSSMQFQQILHEDSNDNEKNSCDGDENSTTSESLDNNKSPILTKQEIDEALNGISYLPPELSRLIDIFIDDLRQPKYVRPLSVLQLSSLFQSFYIKFDKASFQHVSSVNNVGNYNTNGGPSSFLAAKETLSSGLSGIFGRSRSSSGTSIMRPRRSSSLFSNESMSNSNNATQMLSPEEIKKQLMINELNNMKIEKYMEFCERDVFKKILIVGTSVSSPNKTKAFKPHQLQTFKVGNLFRNSAEFTEYNKLLNEKISCLSKLSTMNKIDLIKFLSLNNGIDPEPKFEEVKDILYEFTYHSISPCEKIKALLKLHEIMTYSQEMSNDDYLSLLIYYIITIVPRDIFLNAEFIRLFRYKKKLVETESFALTNLEAALVFVEGLTKDDFSNELKDKLTENEGKVLESSISSKVSLPSKAGMTNKINSNGNSTMGDIMTPSIQRPDVTRSNSYDGFKTVFDSSLKNIIGKIRSYTPPHPNTVGITNLHNNNNNSNNSNNSNNNLNIPRSSSQLSIELINRDTLEMSRDGSRSMSSSSRSSASLENANREFTGDLTVTASANGVGKREIQKSWKKYKGYKFDDLTICELRDLFEIYQKIMQ